MNLTLASNQAVSSLFPRRSNTLIASKVNSAAKKTSYILKPLLQPSPNSQGLKSMLVTVSTMDIPMQQKESSM
jgi:hypothetical protein